MNQTQIRIVRNEAAGRWEAFVPAAPGAVDERFFGHCDFTAPPQVQGGWLADLFTMALRKPQQPPQVWHDGGTIPLPKQAQGLVQFRIQTEKAPFATPYQSTHQAPPVDVVKLQAQVARAREGFRSMQAGLTACQQSFALYGASEMAGYCQAMAGGAEAFGEELQEVQWPAAVRVLASQAQRAAACLEEFYPEAARELRLALANLGQGVGGGL